MEELNKFPAHNGKQMSSIRILVDKVVVFKIFNTENIEGRQVTEHEYVLVPFNPP